MKATDLLIHALVKTAASDDPYFQRVNKPGEYSYDYGLNPDMDTFSIDWSDPGTLAPWRSWPGWKFEFEKRRPGLENFAKTKAYNYIDTAAHALGHSIMPEPLYNLYRDIWHEMAGKDANGRPINIVAAHYPDFLKPQKRINRFRDAIHADPSAGDTVNKYNANSFSGRLLRDREDMTRAYRRKETYRPQPTYKEMHVPAVPVPHEDVMRDLAKIEIANGNYAHMAGRGYDNEDLMRYIGAYYLQPALQEAAGSKHPVSPFTKLTKEQWQNLNTLLDRQVRQKYQTLADSRFGHALTDEEKNAMAKHLKELNNKLSPFTGRELIK